MSLVKWDKSFSVGVREMDEQHVVLIDLINTFYDRIGKGERKENFSTLLQGLKEYAEMHFIVEEDYMMLFGFDGYQDHKKEHDNNKSNMVTTIFGLCSMLSENSLFSSDKVETIVIPNKNLKNEYISIDYNKIHFSKTFEEKQKSLATSYGITLTKKETIVNVIRIREKK